MNLPHYIAQKILSQSGKKKSISRPIVKIAIGGIALGIAVMIITLAIVVGFQNEIRDKVTGFSSHITVASYDNNVSYEPSPISRHQQFSEQLKNNDAIQHIQVFATKNGIIKTKTDNEGVILKGIDADYDWTFMQSVLKEGSVLKNLKDSLPSREIIISSYLANRLGIKLGGKMLVYFVTEKKGSEQTDAYAYEQRVRDFYVKGIYETGFDEYDSKIVFVDIAQLQKLNYWTADQVGGFEIALHQTAQLDMMGDYIHEICGQGLTAQTIKQANPSIFSWLDLMDTNALIIIVLMLLVSGINMISALLIIILERTNMIGILKALGAANNNIREIFIYQALYLIGRGMLWGNLIGISLIVLQHKYKWISMPQETYYISYIPIHIDYLHILLLNVCTFFVCTLMMIIPTLIITKISPVKAIRFN